MLKDIQELAAQALKDADYFYHRLSSQMERRYMADTSEMKKERERLEKMNREIRQYATIEELDETVLNRLISRIVVGEVKKVDGQKYQEVKIIYNFVGEIPDITK